MLPGISKSYLILTGPGCPGPMVPAAASWLSRPCITYHVAPGGPQAPAAGRLGGPHPHQLPNCATCAPVGSLVPGVERHHHQLSSKITSEITYLGLSEELTGSHVNHPFLVSNIKNKAQNFKYFESI